MSTIIDFMVMSVLYLFFIVGRYVYYRKKPKKFELSFVQYKDVYNARRRWRTRSSFSDSFIARSPGWSLTFMTIVLMAETFVVFAILL
jgi:hypothetical protein